MYFRLTDLKASMWDPVSLLSSNELCPPPKLNSRHVNLQAATSPSWNLEMAKRLIQSLRARPSFGQKQRTTFCGTGIELPVEIPIEKETIPGYEAKSYFPVEPGYVFNQKYEALEKLGWGSCSSVWLVRDIQRCGPSTTHPGNISLTRQTIDGDGNLSVT